MDKKIGIAVDIGTTTLAFSVMDESGRRLAAFSCANSQRVFGTDVITRITRANEGDSARLNSLVKEDINHGINKVLAAAGFNIIHEKNVKISRIVIAGNTTMLHLLQNLPCKSLGEYPFLPVNINLVRENFNLLRNIYPPSRQFDVCQFEGCEIIILPGISAFVGADISAGIFYCCFPQGNRPVSQGNFLYIDLGTNAEIAVVYGNGKKILVTSAAAGPAFEGGNIIKGIPFIPGAISSANFLPEAGVFMYETVDNKPPIGICGTGVADITAEIIRHGLATAAGDFIDAGKKTGDCITIAKRQGKPDIVFTQKDMREVQLAKSAVRAGIEILLEESGLLYENIAEVFLAGGFAINPETAATLGILPKQLVSKVTAVGNAAIAGCEKAMFGDFSQISEIAASANEVNLAMHPRFEELFIEHMRF
ncbi:MAG: ASKHA domain-containing protein [Defluviitaleaceae bacterium]|nr:ASKHA domain-containing protein [Defluviitaleaceae bacterium]